MFHLLKKSALKAGLPPGTLVHVGEERTAPVTIDLIEYDAETYREQRDVTVEACNACRQSAAAVSWINVNGVHDVHLIEALGRLFDLHPLLLEDVVHTDQRPKVDDFENEIFIVLKMLMYAPEEDDVRSEQVSLVLGPRFVISFQETEGDVFDPVRERLRQGRGRIRKMGSDYLAYSLMDSVVDQYFAILEVFGEKIEDLSEALLENPGPGSLETIQGIKHDLIFLRKSVWPLREAVNALERSESSLITDGVLLYLRDVYDHTIQVMESVETFRETVGSALDIYLSAMSNRMNGVMKVLTIIATIFIPLTFIAGIYGMNFKYMPELEWRYGYWAVWALMIALFLVMLIGFKRKKWL